MCCGITATEINNSGFYVERRNDIEGSNNLGFVKGHGTTTEKQSYTFLDINLVSGIYYYRLKQIDNDESFEYSNVIEVDLEMPLEFSLSQNFPNPFNPSTKITYTIPERSNISLKVLDLLGSEVVELVSGEIEAGTYDITFNAANPPSGIYFYRLQAGNFVQTRKMILLK